MTLGKRIEERREAEGLDRFGLAVKVRAAGHICTERDVWRWETDRNKPSVEALCAIATALDVDPRDLVLGAASEQEAVKAAV